MLILNHAGVYLPSVPLLPNLEENSDAEEERERENKMICDASAAGSEQRNCISALDSSFACLGMQTMQSGKPTVAGRAGIFAFPIHSTAEPVTALFVSFAVAHPCCIMQSLSSIVSPSASSSRPSLSLFLRFLACSLSLGAWRGAARRGTVTTDTQTATSTAQAVRIHLPVG